MARIAAMPQTDAFSHCRRVEVDRLQPADHRLGFRKPLQVEYEDIDEVHTP